MRTTTSIVIALLLFMAVPACADDGLALEIVNQSGTELNVTVYIMDMATVAIVNRKASAGATVRISNSETKHREAVAMAKWKIKIGDEYEYLVLPNEGDCQVSSEKSSRASIDQLGICSYRFTIQ
ncbi:hypothetical protein [Pseudodesulfovibrio sp. S3]|uniref:hypothetical protein n=2 Tax=unclassified Pseudodesulfovibrio TaxID=2661612 RepID=UPI0013E392FA|nr:hypothetical protein [Pseudodesulfovibrio sp. S3]MCJ2165370.1 hypothetical protein [Pseudodesulfovibrio sp. S3-i]